MRQRSAATGQPNCCECWAGALRLLLLLLAAAAALATPAAGLAGACFNIRASYFQQNTLAGAAARGVCTSCDGAPAVGLTATSYVLPPSCPVTRWCTTCDANELASSAHQVAPGCTWAARHMGLRGGLAGAGAPVLTGAGAPCHAVCTHQLGLDCSDRGSCKCTCAWAGLASWFPGGRLDGLFATLPSHVRAEWCSPADGDSENRSLMHHLPSLTHGSCNSLLPLLHDVVACVAAVRSKDQHAYALVTKQGFADIVGADQFMTNHQIAAFAV